MTDSNRKEPLRGQFNASLAINGSFWITAETLTVFNIGSINWHGDYWYDQHNNKGKRWKQDNVWQAKIIFNPEDTVCISISPNPSAASMKK